MKAAFLGLAMLAASATASATTIDTMTQSGFDFRCLGIDAGCGQVFGQTFTVSTADTYLSSFSFAPTSVSGGDLKVQFSIYAWSGTNKTGAALFQSGIYAMPAGGSATMLNYTPGLTLTQGQKYVAFLSTAGMGNTSGVTSGFSYLNDTYGAGEFLWQRTASDTTWFNTGGDSRFTAVFTGAAAAAAVPEPANLALLGLGSVALMLARRRKQK